MYRYVCKECGGLVDPGELVGETCTECLEERRLEEEKGSQLARMLDGPWEQMVMELEAMDYGRQENY